MDFRGYFAAEKRREEGKKRNNWKGGRGRTDTCTQRNKWSKNFEEKLHRCLATPCGGEWIRPTLTPSNT